MISGLRDTTADQAVARYRMLLMGFEGIYTRALPMNPGLPRTRSRALRDLLDLAGTFMSGERILIERGILAQLPDPVSPGMHDHAEALAADLATALQSQLGRDANSVARALHGAALQAALVGAGRGRPRPEGLKTASMTAPSFGFLDRAGRRWNSDAHVRLIWRGALVLSQAEGTLLMIGNAGGTEAMVGHPDPESPWHDRMIQLDEWPVVRDEAFHPNSRAWIA